jgi:excisionase family DNA binding protein
MDSNGKMYSVKEVAAQLGVSCDTVRRLIRCGFMKAWKLPKRTSERHRIYDVYRISADEMQRVINAWLVASIRRRVS